jgi:hypothetical protein
MSEKQMKDELISLIDLNKETWIKAAFFSDETVEKIMEILYSRWEANNEEGIPLDYAYKEELEILLKIARKYVKLSPDEARSIVIKRIYSEE